MEASPPEMVVNPDLEFSAIEYKSPTWSESYNSIVNSKHASIGKAPLPEAKQIESVILRPKPSDNPEQLPAYSRAEMELQVPTFFMKMPPAVRELDAQEKKNCRKKIQEDINQELRDIYNGKFKISWNPNPQQHP
jgi:hypothetical protein